MTPDALLAIWPMVIEVFIKTFCFALGAVMLVALYCIMRAAARADRDIEDYWNAQAEDATATDEEAA